VDRQAGFGLQKNTVLGITVPVLPVFFGSLYQVGHEGVGFSTVIVMYQNTAHHLPVSIRHVT
jgi:hypothetical protein